MKPVDKAGLLRPELMSGLRCPILADKILPDHSKPLGII
jgi:hypothetical protein